MLKFVALCVGDVSCAEVDAFAAQHASAVPRSQWTTGLSACK